MSAPDFKRLEELLLTSRNEALTEAEQAVLNALMREHAEARAFAARFLTLDALLAETLAAGEARREHEAASPADFRPSPTTATWLAKAAAWIVGFRLFSDTANTATAATTASQGTTVYAQTTFLLLMKKAITSVTAALLLIGGSSLYLIHRHNQNQEERLAHMETEVQNLSEKLGVQSPGSTVAAPRDAQATKLSSSRRMGAAEMIALFTSKSRSREQDRALGEAVAQIKSMDAPSLQKLLRDAESLTSPIPGHFAELALRSLAEKDPAEATRLATEFISRGSGFQFHMSIAAAKSFKAWMAKDPASADAWYVANAAAQAFDNKGVPPNGLGDLEISRSLARIRFAAQVGINPATAEAMLDVMVAKDVINAMKEVTDPAAVARMLPKLRAEQRGPAAEGVIKNLAANDLGAAFTWADTLGMEKRQRDTLLASAIESASGSGKLDLTGVAQASKDLDLEPKRRSELQVSAALTASLIPSDKRPAVAWDQVSENCDWLRAQAPEGLAEKQLGTYLGRLAYQSHQPEKFFEVFEREAARHGAPNLDLTVSFATTLILVEDDSVKAGAIKLLKKFPASEKRDDAIRSIEMNR